MEIPDWVLNPFTYVCASDTSFVIQEELIAVKNDFELKASLQKIVCRFLLTEIKKFLKAIQSYGRQLNFISLLMIDHLTWLNADLVQFLNFLSSKEIV